MYLLFIVLIVLAALLLCFVLPVLHHQTRLWVFVRQLILLKN